MAVMYANLGGTLDDVTLVMKLFNTAWALPHRHQRYWEILWHQHNAFQKRCRAAERIRGTHSPTSNRWYEHKKLESPITGLLQQHCKSSSNIHLDGHSANPHLLNIASLARKLRVTILNATYVKHLVQPMTILPDSLPNLIFSRHTLSMYTICPNLNTTNGISIALVSAGPLKRNHGPSIRQFHPQRKQSWSTEH